jgi:hypothetical protein
MRRSKRRVSLVTVLGALALASCFVPATSALAAAPAACGDVITSDQTLVNDLINCPGDGLVVAASGVTIDLNGHTVSGLGAGSGISTRLVAETPSDVTIKNGVVRGFEIGIYTAGGDDIVLSRLTVRENGTGIRLDSGTRALVSRNQVINNENDGLLSGIPGGNSIRDNSFVGNGRNGLVVAEDSGRIVDGNFASHNGSSGILVVDSVTPVTNNTLLHNGAYGLQMSERISSFWQHYVVADNVADRNGLGGIYVVCQGCPVPPLVPAPPVPPVASGNAAKNNQGFECRFEASFGLGLTFIYDELTCARTRGQARSTFAVPAAVPRHP